jgi:hypothetical protein
MSLTDIQSIFWLTLHQEIIIVESLKNNTSLTSQSNINENMTLLYFEGVTLIDFLLLFSWRSSCRLLVRRSPPLTALYHLWYLSTTTSINHVETLQSPSRPPRWPFLSGQRILCPRPSPDVQHSSRLPWLIGARHPFSCCGARRHSRLHLYDHGNNYYIHPLASAHSQLGWKWVVPL